MTFATNGLLLNAILSFVTATNAFFDSSLWELGKTYPPEWVERCGDADGSIPLFQDRADVFKTCFEEQANISMLTIDVLEGFTTGKLAGVTKKYCSKVKNLEACIDDFAHSVEHCFESGRQKDLWTTAKMAKAALNFVCYKDGERILIFVRDDGIECYEHKRDDIYKCVNETKPEDFTNITAPGEIGFIASLSYDDKMCTHLNKMSKCLYNVTAQCTSNRTPSLIVEALTKTILKHTPCWQKVSAAPVISELCIVLLVFCLSVLGYRNMCL